MIDGKLVCWWIGRRLLWARRRGWKGVVISGYRSRRAQQRAAREFSDRVGVPISQLYPQGPLASNHLGRRWPGGAVDVTDPEGLQRAMLQWSREGRPRPLRGGGSVLRNDRPHFSSSGR